MPCLRRTPIRIAPFVRFLIARILIARVQAARVQVARMKVTGMKLVGLQIAGVLVAVFLGISTLGTAQESTAAPALPDKPVGTSQAAEVKRAENLPDDINRGFLDPDMKPEEYIKRFEVESREVFAQRRAIVESLELKEGLAVADIGAGTGLFLKPLSVAVSGSGKVYAVEISPSFVKHLRNRIEEEKLNNSQVVFCSDRDANLPKDSVDRMLVCDVYHHFEFPEAPLTKKDYAITGPDPRPKK